MKKTTIISIFLIFCISKFAFSQFKYGLNAGIGINKELIFKNQNNIKYDNTYQKNALSYSIGFNANVGFLKILRISTELNFISKNIKYHDPDGIVPNEIVKPYFLENPIYLSIIFFKKFSFNIGFSNNFFLNKQKIYSEVISTNPFYVDSPLYTNSFLTGISFLSCKKIDFQFLFNSELKAHLVFTDEKTYFRTGMFKITYYFN